MDTKYYVGVDLGGTKIATLLCDSQCNIVSKVKMDTNAASGEQEVLKRIQDSICQVMNTSGVDIKDVAGIGICSPGPLSVSRGIVIYVATLDWRDVPIRQILENEFGVPVYLENDCNAAAYGELLRGAGRGYRDMVYITVSTGIGSGIVVDGKIVHGKHDAAGEFGHICIESDGRLCSCGNRGCLQAYASGTSIAQIAAESAFQYPGSNLFLPAGKPAMTCEMVAQAATGGDDLAKNIWKLAGEKLGQGISILLQLLDPDIVVIGGGVSKAWELFYGPMMEAVGKNVYRLIGEDVKIVPAQLGGDAGALGAVLIASGMIGG